MTSEDLDKENCRLRSGQVKAFAPQGNRARHTFRQGGGGWKAAPQGVIAPYPKPPPGKRAVVPGACQESRGCGLDRRRGLYPGMAQT